MFQARRIRIGALLALVAGTTLVAFDVQPAAAAPTNCTYGWNLSLNQESATCTDLVQETWYLRLTCERFNGLPDIHVNGSAVYGPGRGTSIARCPSGTEISGSTLMIL
ncbi:hypothetical protein [Micromonospora zhanjiangensis]|uniref:Alpha amylase inhibitor n=1 Tax=Micromonospora zhanjiangensis TaxID=1522057 RepID=A0ABV8KK17_9ACTN